MKRVLFLFVEEIIKKSAKKQRLIDIKGHSFFEAVNKKLMTPIK